jgi:hypothetical protein
VQAAFIRGIRDVAVGDLAEPEPTGDELLIEVEAVGICGSIVLVGIPEGDGYALQASLARRKGLGVRFSRRMGHVYPRAIELVRRGQVDVRRIAPTPSRWRPHPRPSPDRPSGARGSSRASCTRTGGCRPAEAAADPVRRTTTTTIRDQGRCQLSSNASRSPASARW